MTRTLDDVRARVVEATRDVDVRLALGTGAAWIAVVLCTGRSLLLIAACGAVAGVVGIACLRSTTCRQVLGRYAAAVGLGALCVALVLVPLAARTVQARASPLVQLADDAASVTAVVTVAGDPRVSAPTGTSGQARAVVDTTLGTVRAPSGAWALSGHLLVLAPAEQWSAVLPGQKVSVEGQLLPPLTGSTQVALSTYAPPALIGRPPWFQRAAGVVRSSLRVASSGLPLEERGLLPGLVDGDTTELDPVLQQRFRAAGLTHLVAVSGTNCSIVIGAVLLVLGACGVRPRTKAIVGGLVLAGFVLVARPSPSVLRAALMAAVALAALVSGRPRPALPALSAVVLALLVWDPTLATDDGFVMSVLATAALLLIAPGWARALRRHHVPIGVAESLAVAAAAHVVTAPVIAAISGQVSLVAIPANLLAEPAVPAATLLGFVAALVAPVAMPIAKLLAELAGWPCRWLVGVADTLGGLPGATVPWPSGTSGGLALLAAVAVSVWLVRRSRWGRLVVALVLVVAMLPVPLRVVAPSWPPPGWLMIGCDIGQGDGFVVNAGPHAVIEIDSGPDPVPMDRCLHDLGVTDVPLLVFSHYHLDHVGGVVGVFHGRRVGRILTGPDPAPAAGFDLVQQALAQHHQTISTPPVGAQFSVGDVGVRVLGPAEAAAGTDSDPNNSSLVLMVTVRGVRILFPGDAEIDEEQKLLDAGVDLHADVLKVPHHGSAKFVPQFLAATHARVAVTSDGLHNDYGQPAPSLLDELAALGMQVHRTDLDGDVAVVGTPGRLGVVDRGPSASGANLLARDNSGGGDGALGRVGTASGARPTVASGLSSVDARMGAWRARSPSRICPTSSRRSCSSSATRNCSSRARSARSPPQSAPASPSCPRARSPAARSRAPNCTSCSARRCSATPGSS